jgi:carboxyl-terminal processing protease
MFKLAGRPAQVLGAFLLFFLGVAAGQFLVPALVADPTPTPFTFATFWEAWNVLHGKFTGPLDDNTLFYGAVEGMIRAAGDPYTAFADPAETKQFTQTIEGSFFGVGIEVGVRNGLVTVIAPIADSPADLAGIREGDTIIAVDEEPLTADMTLDDVVSRIRGERGTQVKLTLVHKDERETEEITVTRQKIEIESVKTEVADGVAHITITSFNSDTADRFAAAARDVSEQRVRGIILDLRNNPGGFLQSSVDIASHFLPRGTVVVTERGKESTEYTARGPSNLVAIPTVVLINEGSASASEILAGALNDQRGLPLVGTQTFGKGSVQEFVTLKDGSSLRITIAKWFTPQGRNIDEEGIAPTITSEQDFTTDTDEPLERAREELGRLLSS